MSAHQPHESSIGIIGTGIAGMGCAYFLRKKYDVTLYERNDYVGGHTNTVTVDEDGLEVPIDTGFMVYNEVTYPNLVRLFKELNVETKNSSMSFSVQHIPSGLEFCGSSLNHLFAQRKNLFNPRFIRMLMQIDRFNGECVEVLENERFASYTLQEYVNEKGFGGDMLMKYLVPMSSAVWSTPPDQMLKFPAVTLVRFFRNHGFLGLNTQHQWKTVVGGTRSYRDKLISSFRSRIKIGNPAVKIFRNNGKAEIRFADGTRVRHDKVILACHGDEALRLLEKPTRDERRLLGEFKYQHNSATVHADASVMPKTRMAWSSWNYRLDVNNKGRIAPSTVYYMNSLQQVSKKRDYFVSIDDPGIVDPRLILRTIDYTHPIFSLGAMNAQKELPLLNNGGPVYYCGSYFKYGFHEDAFTSALDLCRVIAGEDIWPANKEAA